MTRSQNNMSFIKTSSILRGLIVSLIILLSSSIFLGVIISLTNITSNSVNTILFALNYLALFVGGVAASYSAQNNGWLNGGLVGVIYMAVIILLGSLWTPITISLGLVTRVAIGFAVSALGGMIGINAV
ncbi:TIGR04086 family membrane protein [Natroniella sulfidigena]|uniref:TIGR04086 family membrane protein n=1 Tax=Natroniella sulfidigena TaxID=723921 RepID=UPI00200A74D6|nr:TIGR04086 family membrane protein [Natroniella sulfidigena]MCK8817992.1 TIGR04086 family membrane protein [Natroniella sulfidigena]